MNSSMITNEKHEMNTRLYIDTRIKMIADANQSVHLNEKRKFYKISGYSTNDGLRIYMESRKESILKDTFMKKTKIVRSVYLLCLRVYSKDKHSYNLKLRLGLGDALYTRGVNLKTEIFKGLEENSNYVSDKDRRYIKMVISTIEKYKKQHLEIKTSMSVEILRAIRCKYIDRVIMGFL